MAKKAQITVGSPLRFKKYSQVQEGDETLFSPDDYLRVVEVHEEGTDDEHYTVGFFTPKEGKNDPGYRDTGDKKKDTEIVYPDEVHLVIEDEAEEAYIDDPEHVANHQSAYTPPAAPSASGGKKQKKNKTDKTETDKDTTNMKTALKKGAKPAAKKAVLAKSGGKKPAAKKAAKKSGKLAKPAAEVVVLPPVKDTPKVLQVIKSHGNDPLKAVHALEQENQITSWALGGVLSHIKRNSKFTKVGSKKYTDDQPGFEQFCDEQLPNTGYRKAMLLIANYDHLTRLGVPEEKAAALPYYKLNVVLKVITDEKTADKWIDKADELDVSDLRTEVRSSAVGVKPRGIRTAANQVSKLTFKVFNDAKSVILKAVEMAKKKLPKGKDGALPTDGEALSHICGDWAANVGD